MEGSIVIAPDPTPIPLGDRCLIGRDVGVDILLNDHLVSGAHSLILRMKERYILCDLDATNGTFLNGNRVRSPERLRHRDEIGIGKRKIAFLCEGAPPESRTSSKITETAHAIHTRAEKEALWFVADIKDSCPIYERLPRERLEDIVGEWFATCRQVLRGGGAVIDKIIGDCVFAYWNSIESKIRDRAIDSARKLVQDTTKLSASHAEVLKAHGLRLDCGVGLHCGTASMVTIMPGHQELLGYDVNVAFRVESLTRKLDTTVLLSRAFVEGWDAAADRCESCGEHAIKGFEQRVELFRLKDSRPPGGANP